MLIWKPIPGLERYQISESGDLVRINSGKFTRIRGVIDVDGYIRYAMTDSDGKRINKHCHYLVAIAFIGPKPSDSHEIAHNNGSRIHNHFLNLRWATRKENDLDRKLHSTDPSGIRNGRAKITDDDVRYIRKRYREIKLLRLKVSELDLKFGLSRGQIIRIARKEAWSHVED